MNLRTCLYTGKWIIWKRKNCLKLRRQEFDENKKKIFTVFKLYHKLFSWEGGSLRSGWHAKLQHHSKWVWILSQAIKFTFRKYLWEKYESLHSFSYRLNSTTAVPQQGWLWHQTTHKSWYAIKQRNQTTNF